MTESAPIEWRLLRDEAANGAWNMAVDEAMLWAHARGFSPPTLRFYGWNPSCLSLGRLQKQWPAAAREAGFDMVRRPTGGRAVWHCREITYCVVVREEILPPDARSVAGAYHWVSEGFLRGLQSLGLPVEMAPSGVRTQGSNCFTASANCDFVANGKKLIGAAQFRREDTIMQHGSLLLEIDDEAWTRFAGGPMHGATSLADFSVQLDANSLAETVIKALCEGFASVAGEAWPSNRKNRAGKLTERERKLARLLFEQKYGCDEWNLRAQVESEVLEGIENALLP